MKTYAVAMLWIMPDGGTRLGSAAIVAPDAAMAAATLVANSRPDPDARFNSISVQVISEEFMVWALGVMRDQPGEKVVALRPVEPQACSTCGKYPCVCEDVTRDVQQTQAKLDAACLCRVSIYACPVHGPGRTFLGPPLGDGAA